MNTFSRRLLILTSGFLLAGHGVCSQPVSAAATIDAARLCGSWQTVPGSGGFHMLNARGGPRSGFGGGNGNVTYQIQGVTPRQFLASQSIEMKKGIKVHIADQFTSSATRKLLGVIQGEDIHFAVAGEPAREQWSWQTDGSFDVIGVEAGAQPTTYHYTVRQTAAVPCRP